jgi:hypothetical protein
MGSEREYHGPTWVPSSTRIKKRGLIRSNLREFGADFSMTCRQWANSPLTRLRSAPLELLLQPSLENRRWGFRKARGGVWNGRAAYFLGGGFRSRSPRSISSGGPAPRKRRLSPWDTPVGHLRAQDRTISEIADILSVSRRLVHKTAANHRPIDGVTTARIDAQNFVCKSNDC